MEAVDLIVTVVRVWAGVVMLAHGINHARNLDGTAKWFGKVGFKAARRQAEVSAFGEIAIALLLILGLLTTFGAFGLVAVVSVAFWSIHRFAGFFVFARPDEGYEYVVTLSLAAVMVATVGPGPLSFDAFVGIADELDGWTGLLIAAAGILAAAGQLALTWRKPT